MVERIVKNILLLYDNLRIGGAQKHLLDLANNLSRKSQYKVFVAAKKGDFCSQLDKNIVYYDLDLTLNNPLSFIICYFKLRKFILNNSIDIVHSHSRRMNSIIFALNNSGLKFAYVSTAHSVFSRLHFFGFWSKNTIAVSNKVKEYIVKHSDVNVTVIENGVIYQKPIFSKEIFRRKIKLSNSDFVLCSVGRLSEQKNQIDLIYIMQELREKSPDLFNKTRLLIVGGGDERIKINLVNKIKELRLEKNIFLMGSRNDVPDFLNCSDLFILSSKWEGLPLVVIESFSHGVPVIAYDAGGTSSVVNTNNGAIIKIGDISSFVDKIIDLSDDDLRSLKSKNSLKTYKTKFTFDRQFEQTNNYYLSLMKEYNNKKLNVDKWSDDKKLFGLFNISKLYKHIFKGIIFPISELFERTSIKRKLKFLKNTQFFDRKKMNLYQCKKLKDTIEHAYNNTEYYKTLFDSLNLKPSDIKSKKDLVKIPFLTKAIVRKNTDKLRAVNFRKKSYPKSTSGSTGEPTIFYQTKDDFSWIWAAHFRAWGWAGYTPGDRYVKLSITEENKRWKKKLQNLFFRCKFIRVYDMSEESIKGYVEKIISFRPVLIYGYSSSLNAIAEYMNKKGIKFETKAVVTTGDKLMPNYHRNIKKAFGCNIYDEFGCGGEGLYIAAQCEKGNYHISDELMIIEENKGEIVITSLNNYAMPLIRYKSGDNIELGEGCSCGRHSSIIKSLKGRTNEFVRTRAGVMLNSQFFEYIMEVLPGVSQFKIIQIDYDNIEIHMRCNDEYKKDESERRIKEYILKSSGVKLSIKYVYVAHFNSNDGHKFKTIESRII